MTRNLPLQDKIGYLLIFPFILKVLFAAKISIIHYYKQEVSAICSLVQEVLCIKLAWKCIKKTPETVTLAQTSQLKRLRRRWNTM